MNYLDLKFKYNREFKSAKDYSNEITEITKLKTFESKIKYYNDNIRSLSISLMSGKLFIPPDNSESLSVELKLYCDCPTCIEKNLFSPKQRATYLKLRKAEFDRVNNLINTKLTFIEKYEEALKIKGFEFGSFYLFDNIIPNNLLKQDDEMFERHPEIYLKPTTQEEISLYNKLIMAQFNSESEKGICRFQIFNSKNEKEKLAIKLSKAIDPKRIIDNCIKEIQQNFSYPPNEDIKKRALQHNRKEHIWFLQIIEGDEVNLNVEVLKLYDLGLFTHVKEIADFYRFLNNYGNSEQQNEDSKESIIESQNTTARQVLIMHYILKYLKVDNIDATKRAELIQFLTGKSSKNVYDLVRNPLTTKQGDFRQKDLQVIRIFFENLGLEEIVKMINNELEISNK